MMTYKMTLQEEFYLEQSTEKAIAMDSWTRDALATSMIDDVYFVMQKCSQRAIATRNVQSVATILNQINSLLSVNLRSVLDSRWKVLPSVPAASDPAKMNSTGRHIAY